MGAAVDLIEPMGFEWDDRRVRRSAMDYIDHVAVSRHANFEAFKATIGSRRLVLLTTKATQSVYDFGYLADDILLFGKESAGVPLAVLQACDARVRVPMRSGVRSIEPRHGGGARARRGPPTDRDPARLSSPPTKGRAMSAGYFLRWLSNQRTISFIASVA